MKRSAGNQLSILNWDQEDESEPVLSPGDFAKADAALLSTRVIKTAKRKHETTPKSGIFAGFSGFKTNSKPSVNFASSVGTPNTKNPDDEQQSYLAELSSLNRSVSDWIDQHVRENACIDLTPIFADYKEHLSTIAKKYGRSLSLRNNEKSTESSPPFGDAVKSTSFTNNSSSMSNSTSNANTTINFGEANANKTSNPTTGLFGFFSNSSSTSSTSSSMTTSTSSSFNFKMTSATDADPPSSKPFAFGSLSTPFTFAKFSQSNSNTSSLLTNSTVPKVEEKNNDDAEEQPEEPLKVEFTEVQEKDAFFSIRCKLYFKRDGSYKTKGFGMLHLKKMENNKTQLLMRADTNLGNVMLNILFNPLMPYSQNGKHVNLVAVANPPFDAKCQLCNKAFPNPQESNQCEDKCQQKPDCMLLRLSSPDDAEKLIKQLDELKESK